MTDKVQPEEQAPLALVTGAGGGLGRAVCHVLAEAGFHLAVVDVIDESSLKNNLSAIVDSIDFLFPEVDFGELDSISSVLQSFLPQKNWTVLVNNAGVSVGGKLSDATLEEWQLMLDVNLTAPFILTQLFVNNAKKFTLKGSIINISSMVGIIGTKKPGYAASKAGLIGLTKATALQAGPKVRCNAIYPGAMKTPMTADWDEATRKMICAKTPLARIAEPEEIAQIVGFLADNSRSSFLTGAIINATGGQYLGQ